MASHGCTKVSTATAAMEIPRVVENHSPITAATTKAPVMLATKLALLGFAATGLGLLLQ